MILDPRNGDIEDDSSSPQQRSMFALAGSLLAEISLPKLALTWVLLVGLPGLLLGATPLVLSLWVTAVSSRAADIFTDIWPVLGLVLLGGLAWFGGRPLLRLAETSFWSLNALAVQPVYVAFREGLRHLAERLLPRMGEQRRTSVRAGTAGVAGLVVGGLGVCVIAAVWPATSWVGDVSRLATPLVLLSVLLANAVVMIAAYFAAAALVWGIADATMPQPRDFHGFVPSGGGRAWRVAHLSDIHAVGERYGFRIESGRAGPRGNARMGALFARLDAIHAAAPLDLILITGDMTDAGRSAEWAEFFAALAAYPRLQSLVVALPGNHDVNVVDRASPARLDLPTSPTKRLRQLRTLSALNVLQGGRMRIVDPATGQLGPTLADALQPHAGAITAFADTGSFLLSRQLAGLWPTMFPMVLPPESDTGLGVIVLNSNAETHFSFTNALGLIAAEQVRLLHLATAGFPGACWIVALHHHVVEYPRRAKALSERIGTALINGSWFVRQLRPLAHHAVIMHGHRHVDWVGACGGLVILSAPSPVMDATDAQETHFYIHTFAVGAGGRLAVGEPERITLPGIFPPPRPEPALPAPDPRRAYLRPNGG